MDWLACEKGLSDVGTREARVMAVVDDASVRDALHRFLTAHGIQLEAFPSGEQLLWSSHVDLVTCLIVRCHE